MVTSGHRRSGAPSCVFKILASTIALAFVVFISVSSFFACRSHSADPPSSFRCDLVGAGFQLCHSIITRQVVFESKESFDNHLKIQKSKDTIFAVNEQLTKAKKQGPFASLTAAKSIPKSLHCLSMRLMEERTSRPEKYVDDEKPTLPELEYPNLYHYAIFSNNVLAA